MNGKLELSKEAVSLLERIATEGKVYKRAIKKEKKIEALRELIDKTLVDGRYAIRIGKWELLTQYSLSKSGQQYINK